MAVTAAFVNIVRFETARCPGERARRGESGEALTEHPLRARACALSSRVTDGGEDQGDDNSADDKDRSDC